MRDEKEFSWSLSRESLFVFCPRAYFYHYYGSQGGYEQFSDSELLYQLKKIIPLDLWINLICVETLREFFYEKPDDFDIHKCSKRLYHQGIRSVTTRGWAKDPQQLNLFEIYYGIAEINELIDYGARLLKSYIDNLVESGLVSYLEEIPYLHRKTFAFPASTNIGRIKVWISPVLVWLEDGLLKFLTLNNGSSNARRAHSTAVLHKIYAYNSLRMQPERVVTLNFDLSNGETSALSDDDINVSETINKVRDSSSQMLGLLTDHNAVFEGNFAQNTKNCSKCKFKKYCGEVKS